MDQASVQGNKLYVGGIPYRSTEDDLKKAFSEAGNVVSASIISDRMTGRSRGFGFVEMGSAEEAQAAIDRWDGKELDGRTLSVPLLAHRAIDLLAVKTVVADTATAVAVAMAVVADTVAVAAMAAAAINPLP